MKKTLYCLFSPPCLWHSASSLFDPKEHIHLEELMYYLYLIVKALKEFV